MPIAEKNRKNVNAMDAYAEVARYFRLMLDWGRALSNLEIVRALDLTSWMKVMIYESLRIWSKPVII